MSGTTDRGLDDLIGRYPALSRCKGEIREARDVLIAAYEDSGELLLCGNGGSAADC